MSKLISPYGSQGKGTDGLVNLIVTGEERVELLHGLGISQQAYYDRLCELSDLLSPGSPSGTACPSLCNA